MAPLEQAMGPDSTQRLIYTGLSEAFFAGIFITFPALALPILVLYELWILLVARLNTRHM